METQISETQNELSNSILQCDCSQPEFVVKNEIGKGNLCDLQRIRRIILIEEDEALELKQVLARVLGVYNELVNFR
jgi:hypothetical protein